MLPAKIQEIIFEVRQKERDSIDFRDAVTLYLCDTYDLTETQAALCYNKGDEMASDMERIFRESEDYAKFAYSILVFQKKNLKIR